MKIQINLNKTSFAISPEAFGNCPSMFRGDLKRNRGSF